MAAVAGDASEFDAVLRDQLVELLPELSVGHGLELTFFAALPAVALPAGHPLGEALADVFAVSEQLQIAGPLESREPLDHRLQLHAVVRRLSLGAEGLFDLAGICVAQDVGPTARPRIAAAGAVGEEEDFRLILACHHGIGMTNDESQMSNKCRSTNDELFLFGFRHSFVIGYSSFDIS